MNKSGIEKAKLIVDKVFDYLQNTVDEAVLSMLTEYTENTSGGTIEIIDKLINEIDNGYSEIDTIISNIDYKLDWLKENVDNYWNILKEHYLNLKNINQDENKHSFQLYYETINNLYPIQFIGKKQNKHQ